MSQFSLLSHAPARSVLKRCARIVTLGLALVAAGATANAAERFRIPVKAGTAADNGTLVLQPDVVDFGEVAVTQTKLRKATLVNMGQAPVSVQAVVAPAPFTADSSACSVLAPGARCDVLVSYGPRYLGADVASLEVASSAGPVSGTLLGNAVRLLTDIEVSTDLWYFGSWPVAQTSDARQLVLHNKGTAPFSFGKLGLESGDADFQLTSECGSSLEPNGYCTVRATFTPSEAGLRLGAFRIQGANGSLRDVNMVGYGGEAGYTGAKLSVPGAVNFGEVVVAEGPVNRALGVMNVGSEPLEMAPPVLSGLDAASFAVASECPPVLQPWQACTLTVTANANESRRYEAALVLASNDPGSPRSIPVYAQGTEPTDARIVAEPTVVRLEAAEVGKAVQTTVKLTNSGPNATAITNLVATPGTMFQASQNCVGPLAVGASCDVTVSYVPRFTDTMKGALEVATTSQARPVGVSLVGMLPAPVLRASPSILEFPSPVVIGRTSSPVAIRVSNDGTAPLVLKGISLLDEFLEANSSAFAQNNSCGAPVPPRGSCEISVVARPSVEGANRAVLVLDSNDLAQPSQVVRISATGLQGATDFRSTPESLSFGSVPQGEALERSVSLKNVGTLPGQVVAVGVSGADSGAFVVSNHCAEAVRPQEACAVNVEFRPSELRAYQAVAVVATADDKNVEIALSGTGVIPGESLPQLRLSEASVLFGQTMVGRGGSREIRLFNDGDAPLRIAGLSVLDEDWEGSTEFAQSNSCGSAIASKSYCAINVSFQPATSGTRTGRLMLQTNLPGTEFVEVPMRGDGILGSLFVSPQDLRFSETRPGDQVEQSVWVFNQSSVPAHIVGVGVQGDDFTQVNACGAPIPQGGRCSVTVTFAPKSAGARSAMLTILAEDGTLLPVALSGTGSDEAPEGGQPSLQVTVTPAVMEFGPVQLSSAASQPVTVRNGKDEPQILVGVTANSASGALAASTECVGALAPHESCTFVVTARPSLAGAQTGSIALKFADSVNDLVVGASLIGSRDPVAPAKLAVSPESLDFGLVAQGAPQTQVLTVRNAGEAQAFLKPAVVAQKGTDVSLTNACPTTLQKGESCEVQVHFSGSTRGAASATVTMAAETGSSVQVPVRGQGQEPKAVVNPLKLEFPQTGVLNTSAEQLVVVGNAGNLPLTFRGVSADSGFSVSAGTCGQQVLPGEECSIGVRFAPTEAKDYQGGVFVSTDDATRGTWGINVSGRGLGARLVLSTPSLVFDKQPLGGFEAKTLTVTNEGMGTASLAAPAVTGASFSVASNSCSGLLEPQGTCELTVRFAPSTGGRLSGSLTLPFGISDEVVVSLRGEGPDAVLELATPVVDFGAQSLRAPSPPLELVVRNTGPVSAYVFGAEVQGEGSPFAVGEACRFAPLEPGATCAFPVTFTPMVAPQAIGQVVVSSGNSAGPLTAELRGSGGVPAGRLDLTALDFGAMYTGKARTLETTLTNTSTVYSMVVDSVTGGNGQFVGKANCEMPIPPQETCPIAITAKPSKGGALSETMRVVTTGGEYALTARAQATLVSLGSVTPSEGPLAGGTEVSIIGTGFGSSARVNFGALAAPSVRVVSDTQIFATTPPAAAGKVTVQVLEGEAAPVSMAEGFNYLPAPAITGISPAKGGAVGGWETVLSGKSLTCGMRVTVEGKAATVVACQNGTLRVTVPARAVNASGLVDVAVAHGGGVATLQAGLEYVRDAAALVLNADMASMGNFLQGTSATRSVQLSNVGTLPTDVRSIEVLGVSGDGEYSLPTTGATCAATPFKLYAKRDCLVSVRVAGVSGTVSARLVVNRGAEDETSTELSASFVQPDFAFSSVVKVNAEVASAFQPIAALSMVGKANSPTSRDMTVFFNNVGLVAGTKIVGGRIAVSGPQASKFTIVSVNQVNSTGKVVRGGGSLSADKRTATNVSTADGAGDAPHLQIILRYTPTAAGTDVAQLRLDYDSENFALLPLVGSALYDAEAYLSGTSSSETAPPADFGLFAFNPSTAAAQAGVTKTFYVRNRSQVGALLQVTRLSIAGPDAASFVIAGYGETLTGTGQDRAPTKMVQGSVNAGLPFTVTLTPTRVGSYSAMLVVEHSGLNDQGVLAIPLSAQASRDISLEVSGGLRGEPLPDYNQADGTEQSVNGPVAAKLVFLRNVGTMGKVAYKSVTIEGSPAFTLTRSGLATSNEVALPSGSKSWTSVRYADLALIGEDASQAPRLRTDLGLQVSFKPTTEGEHVARVVVAHDGPGGETVVELRGAAVNRSKVELRRADNQVIQGYTNLDFGVTDPTGGAREIRVEYDGGVGYGAVRLEGVQLSGPDADQFKITKITNYDTLSRMLQIWNDKDGQSFAKLNYLLGVGYGTRKRAGAWGEITLVHKPTRPGTHLVDVTVHSSSAAKKESGTVTVRASFTADLKAAGGFVRLSNDNLSALLSSQSGMYTDGRVYAGYLPGPRAGKHYLELRMDSEYADFWREAQVDFMFNWSSVNGNSSGALSFNVIEPNVKGQYIVAGTDGPFPRPTFKTGDRFGFAYDADNGTLHWYFYEQAAGACRLLGETRLTVKGLPVAPVIRALRMSSTIDVSVTSGVTQDYGCPMPAGYSPWPNL